MARAPTDGSRIVLALQGGGALGAYQAGVYEGLFEAGIEPDWVTGISIGSINAAIIAGNPPERRVDRLRTFWERVSSELPGLPLAKDGPSRSWFNDISAAQVVMAGVAGFFRPKPPNPFLPQAGLDQLAFYTTKPLAETLEELVDFSLINKKGTRLSVGAVDIALGNSQYFDNTKERIGPEHIMASGALPPGLPPVEIDGRLYWDGGLLSNTPLDYVLRSRSDEENLCAFQVDLFSSRGPLPDTLLDAAQREKDIRFSSRTRLNTDNFKEVHTLKSAARRFLKDIPDELRHHPDAKLLEDWCDDTLVTIFHLIYRVNAYENAAKDFEFSRLSMEDHWRSGLRDMRRLTANKVWSDGITHDNGIAIIDANKLAEQAEKTGNL